MYSPFRWRTLPSERRNAFFGAIVWGLLGGALMALTSEPTWQAVGTVLLVLAAVLGVAGAVASDEGLRLVTFLGSLPWPF
jgi:hypothetical protein